MKVTNMTGRTGKPIANQFIITKTYLKSPTTKILLLGKMFQSYISNIVFIVSSTNKVFLDSRYWNYSPTTSKYRNQFLNETTAETQAKIDSGKYTLTNLN